MGSQSYTTKKNELGYFSVEPMPTHEEISNFYRDKYYQTVEQRTSSYQNEYSPEQLEHKRLIAAEIVYAVQQHVDQSQTSRELMDIGCGEGFVLQEAHNQGWTVSGFDFNSVPAQRWNKEIADKIEEGDAYAILQDLLGSGKKIDACILTNVLEHVIDPKALLLDLKRLLKPGGVAAITVPNDYSDLQRHLMEHGFVANEYWFSPPAHLHYFNEDSLTKISEFCRFHVCELFAGFPIEVFLTNPKSSYIADKEAGKCAHASRVMLDLLMSKKGMDKFHDYSKSLAACGAGRTITCVIRNAEES